MCGFFFSELNDGVSSASLIKHRGPDHYKIYSDDFITLYNYRLKIVDQSNKNTHPIFSKSGNTLILFNGEIYNYLELYKKYSLKSKFKSESHIIAEFFDKFGTSKLNELNGMFSLIVYNLKKREILFIRDRLGIKPLNYTFVNKKLYVSSEIKPLLNIRKINKIKDDKINMHSAVDYLYNARITHDNKTFFNNIHSILPGHYAKYNLKNKKYEFTRYHFFKKSKLKNNLQDNLFQLLKSKVKLYLKSKCKSGLLLSGGIDSTLLTLLAKNFKKKLITFTYGFSINKNKIISNIDDVKISTKIAKELNVKNLNTIVTPDFIIKNFDKILKKLETPFTSIRIFGIYKVYLLAKSKGCSMIIDGQGGDEVFGGYKHHMDISNKNFSINNMKKFLNYKKDSGLLKDGSKFIFESLFSKNLKNIKKKYTKTSWTKNYNNIFNKNSLLQNSQIEDISLNTIPRSLHYVDRLSMNNSIEARLPLLDNDIVDFGLNLPDNIKTDNIQSRKIIKNILKKNTSTTKDTKKYITDPQTLWLRTVLKEFILKEFNSNSFKRNRFFNSSLIKKSFIKFVNGDDEIPSYTFFTIFCLSRYMKIFKIS